MKANTRIIASTFIASLALLPWACGKKSETDESTSAKKGGTLKTEVAASRLAVTSNTTTLNLDSGKDFGMATPDSLLAAKYRVIDITLCEKASLDKGDACGDGKVLTLYSEDSTKASDYNTFTSKEAAADTTSFIDFLSLTDRAKLSSSISYSDTHVASYEGVVVHFYRPFKLKGSVKLGSGTTVYTKSSTTFEDNGKTGLDQTIQTNITNSTTASAEEGVFFLSNGGKSFKLQKPLTISSDDVTNQTAYKMVLAFDPDYMLRAANIDASGLPTDWRDGQVDKTNNYKLSAEFLNFAPVIARASETIMRETYILSMTSAVGTLQPHDVKLSLYYVKEDTDKTIRAVTANWMYNSNTTSYINADPLGQIYTVSKNADGTYDFLSSSGVKVLSGFARQTSKSTAFTVASKYCNGGNSSTSGTGCSVDLISKTYTGQLISDVEVTSEGSISYATPVPTTTATTAQ